MRTYLYQIAEVITGIPPTQVPVERQFSVLGIVYTNRRVNLKPQMIENIILIKLNKDIAYQIFERELHDIEILHL